LSTTPINEPSLEQRHHFLLRKLHSLSGIVPIGAFLIEHLLTNSMAFAGPEKFNEAVHSLHELPYLWALEIFGIFLPLAFHAIYGIKIAMTAEYNVASYPYMENRRYTLQRITGYIAFAFLIVHLMKFRFAHLLGWGPEFLDPHNMDKFEITRNGLMAWRPWGLVVPAGVTITMYVIGLGAACYHFANGIWSFCISWGITVGEKAQKRVGMVAAVVGIVLFTWGGLSLYAFVKAPVPGDKGVKPMIAEQTIGASSAGLDSGRGD